MATCGYNSDGVQEIECAPIEIELCRGNTPSPTATPLPTNPQPTDTPTLTIAPTPSPTLCWGDGFHYVGDKCACACYHARQTWVRLFAHDHHARTAPHTRLPPLPGVWLSLVMVTATACQAECAMSGAQMLCVRSLDELMLLTSAEGLWQFTDRNFGLFWLGYNDKGTEG